jgi:hypothetical protein
MSETLTKIVAVQIDLHRAEGPMPLPKPVTIIGSDVWGLARQTLRQWSYTAPGNPSDKLGLGYDKCDFKVTFADGFEYDGRFDLTYHGSTSLAAHMRSFARGLREAADKVPHYAEDADAYEAFLAAYQVGDEHGI